MNGSTRYYERVERRYRPESHRLRADEANERTAEANERAAEANERADATEAENRNLRGRLASIERQLEERGYRRRRPRSNPPGGTGRLPPNALTPSGMNAPGRGNVWLPRPSESERTGGRMGDGQQRREGPLTCKSSCSL